MLGHPTISGGFIAGIGVSRESLRVLDSAERVGNVSREAPASTWQVTPVPTAHLNDGGSWVAVAFDRPVEKPGLVQAVVGCRITSVNQDSALTVQLPASDDGLQPLGTIALDGLARRARTFYRPLNAAGMSAVERRVGIVEWVDGYTNPFRCLSIEHGVMASWFSDMGESDFHPLTSIDWTDLPRSVPELSASEGLVQMTLLGAGAPYRVNVDSFQSLWEDLRSVELNDSRR